MADRFALPDLPDGLHLRWWLFDGQRRELIVVSDSQDTPASLHPLRLVGEAQRGDGG